MCATSLKGKQEVLCTALHISENLFHPRTSSKVQLAQTTGERFEERSATCLCPHVMVPLLPLVEGQTKVLGRTDPARVGSQAQLRTEAAHLPVSLTTSIKIPFPHPVSASES